MHHYIISATLTSLLTTVLGAITIWKRPRTKQSIIFALYSFSISLWSWCVSISPCVPSFSPSVEFLWSRVLHLSCILIPVLFFHFAVICSKTSNARWQLFLAYGLAVFFNLSNIFSATLFTGESVFRIEYAYPRPLAPLYPCYVIFFFILVFLGIFYLLNCTCRMPIGSKVSKFWLFILLSFFGYIGAMDNFFIMADLRIFPFYPFGLYPTVLYAIVTSYLVLRHDVPI